MAVNNENAAAVCLAAQQKAALKGRLADYVTPGLREAENPESIARDFKR